MRGEGGVVDDFFAFVKRDECFTTRLGAWAGISGNGRREAGDCHFGLRLRPAGDPYWKIRRAECERLVKRTRARAEIHGGKARPRSAYQTRRSSDAAFPPEPRPPLFTQ